MPPTEIHAMFHNTRDFTIRNGTFNIIENRYELPRTAHTFSSGLSKLPIVSDESLELLKQLICGSNYCIHAGKVDGRAVAVKVFSGARAKEERDNAVTTSRYLMHPNFLRMMGCSSEFSPNSFIVYHGAFEGSAKRMLASVLREELLKCLLLGVQLVYGISSGLSYLEGKRFPVESAEPTDFDLLIGEDGNLKLGFIPKSFPPSDDDIDASTSQAQPQPRKPEIELLDSLCRMAFQDANRILYRKFFFWPLIEDITYLAIAGDEVDRKADIASDSLTGPQSTVSLDSSSGPQPPTDDSSSVASAGRRELIWKSSDDGATLKEVSEQVEEFLFCLRTPRARRQIRRYVSSGGSKSHHRCPGYSREEIILGSQAHSTVIVSHSSPSPQEVCTVCGDIVDDGGWFSCGCGEPDDGLEPTTNCTRCNVWHHVHCLCVGTSQDDLAANPTAARKGPNQEDATEDPTAAGKDPNQEGASANPSAASEEGRRVHRVVNTWRKEPPTSADHYDGYQEDPLGYEAQARRNLETEHRRAAARLESISFDRRDGKAANRGPTHASTSVVNIYGATSDMVRPSQEPEHRRAAARLQSISFDRRDGKAANRGRTRDSASATNIYGATSGRVRPDIPPLDFGKGNRYM
ncbi:hypothetical protein C8J57DRAFT_1465713 [Mycena rebaudengoi]|nr:hypothetical protein C8J57DRAFT_1465713 [Mycena rebaudengoi]